MTVKEMRDLFSHVENQDLTVRELRGMLFELDDQDALITADDIAMIEQQRGRAMERETEDEQEQRVRY